MSEHLPTIDTLNKTDVIEIDRLSDLVDFEDIVARSVHPNMTKRQAEAWAGRAFIGGMICPERFNGKIFNGTISDITLIPMDDPYDRLFDARDRGWKFTKGRSFSVPNNQRNGESYNRASQLKKRLYLDSQRISIR